VISLKISQITTFMQIRYLDIEICGLSCQLSPMHHTGAESRCSGCKSPTRMVVGCPFITCTVKRKGVEFCFECIESDTCEKWRNHREAGRARDSFKCYQTLEADLSYISRHGVPAFQKIQEQRELLLREMLRDFDEGHSKTYYCIAATVLEPEELQEALFRARRESGGA